MTAGNRTTRGLLIGFTVIGLAAAATLAIMVTFTGAPLLHGHRPGHAPASATRRAPVVDRALVSTSALEAVAWSPDDATFATVSDDGLLRIWDPATGRILRTSPASGDASQDLAYSVAWAPDGKTLATTSGEAAQIHDPATGQTLRVLNGHTDEVTAVTFSPDGKTLATTSHDNTVRIWSAATGQTLRVLTGHTYTTRGVAFSPDGKTLATTSDDGTVRIWDPTTGRTLRTLDHHTVEPQWKGTWLEGTWAVAYSPDGRTLAVTTRDATIVTWDPATGRSLRILAGHATLVTAVAYSPDGSTLATTGDDCTVRIWSAATGQTLRTVTAHTDRVRGVAYSHDGKALATVGDDRTVRIWAL